MKKKIQVRKKKLVAVATLALVATAAFAGNADAASWRTVATASDSSSYGTYAYFSKTTELRDRRPQGSNPCSSRPRHC